jgi:aspartate ammonia-lyase
MGSVSVPIDRLFGAQTSRALANFGRPDSKYSLGARPALIRALLHIKSAAADANERIGFLSRRQHALIEGACDEALRWRDYTLDFPIHILHGGGGTSANMNANEVIANVANRRTGKALGLYDPIHPLDHVNRNQSTNDVYPSACRIAIAESSRLLIESLNESIAALDRLKDHNRHIPRLTRTCLQDAVASDWGRFFGAQSNALSRCRTRIFTSRADLCALNLGGGVAGEPGSSPKRFKHTVIRLLAERLPHLPIRRVTHYADAAQNSDDLLVFGYALDGLARTLVKQCSDLRLLTSGPECGLGEVVLPARQPGSSAMPGKINPVIPEFVIQCSFATIGAVQACGLAVEHADLDLNVWEGVFAESLMSSADLLGDALSSFAELCLAGIHVNDKVSRQHAGSTTAKVTAYARRHSYTGALKLFQDSFPTLSKSE